MTKVEVLKEKAIIIAIEELAELQQALTKMMRGKDKRKNLCEELVDVEITTSWIKEYYQIKEDELNEWRLIKKEREQDMTNIE